MKGNFSRFLLVIIFLVLSSCSNKDRVLYQSTRSVPIKIIFYNALKTHELIVRGYKLREKIFPEKISVKKISMGEEVYYKPADMSSLEGSGVDLTYAWSPNGKLLVLPRGRFEGFTAFSLADLPQAVAHGNGKQSIAIRGRLDTMWWHEFIGWENDDTILFRAGLSGKTFMFAWDIKNDKLRSLDLKTSEYKIEN